MLRFILTAFVLSSITACAAHTPSPLRQEAACYLADGSTSICTDRPRLTNMEMRNDLGVARADWAARTCAAYRDEPWFEKGRAACDEGTASLETLPRPRIGIASGGGGTKASPFAVGAMKRIVDEGWMKHVDVISSVSGGGYAIGLFYSRAAWLDDLGDARESWLDDNCGPDDGKKSHHGLRCLMRNYLNILYPLWSKERDVPVYSLPSIDLMRAPDIAEGEKIKTAFHVNPKGKAHYQHRVFPHERFRCGPRKKKDQDLSVAGQTHYGGPHEAFTWYRCWQDITSTSTAGFATGNRFSLANANKTEQAVSDYDFIMRGLYTRVPDLVSRGVLNWGWDAPINPTWAYWLQRKGVERMSLFMPEHWMSGTAIEDTRKDWRIEAPLTYAALRELAEADPKHRMPVWIANATIRTRPALDPRYIDLTTMDAYRFEIGPYSFGAPQYGHVQAPPDRHGMEVLDGMAASQAFMDPRQRIFAAPINAAANIGLELTAMDWTVPIENYRIPQPRRALTMLTPAPLQFATRLDETDFRPTIHLGDGGVARDNLGVTSLLERRTRKIILLDQTTDLAKTKGHVNLQTLCETNTFLVSRGYTIVLEGNPGTADDTNPFDLSEKCRMGAGSPRILNEPLPFRSWKKKVWKGTLRLTGNRPISESDPLHDTQFYVIKPAMNVDEKVKDEDKDKLDCAFFKQALGVSKQIASPTALRKMAKDAKDGTTAPLTLCGWFEKQEDAVIKEFPQHGVVSLTGNTSWSISNAHTDLGWYLAGDLKNSVFGQGAGSADGTP